MAREKEVRKGESAGKVGAKKRKSFTGEQVETKVKKAKKGSAAGASAPRGETKGTSAKSKKAEKKSETAKPKDGVKAELDTLDDLFQSASAKIKVNKTKKREAEEKARVEFELEKKRRREIELEETQMNPKPVRFDKELGLPIYSEADLRIGQGGNTAECPFDCNCCF